MSTLPVTSRNRWFTSPPSPHGIAVNYVWDPSAVTGIGPNPTTGNYVPLETGMFLPAVGGSVTANPPTYSTISNSTPSGSAGSVTTGVMLGNTPTRKEAYAQVIGSGGPVYIAFNGNAASTTNFNVILKAASSDPGADGGIWDNTSYTGPVSFSGGAGARWIVWQNS